MVRLPSRKELADAYQTLSGRLIDAAGNQAKERFLNLGSWRDDDVPMFIDATIQDMTVVKAQAAKLATGFYREIAKLEGEKFTAPVIQPEQLTTGALRNGADVVQVYTRPFVTLRTALSQDKSMTQALEEAALRVEDIMRTEVQLARRSAGLLSRGRNSNIVGYVRVLSGAENCALCYVASTQRYHSGDLQPIHNNCDCGEMPIYGTTDVGQVIDEERLDAVHGSIAERFGVSDRAARNVDYSKITIHEHGELGPVLTVSGQNFTGPSDLPPPRTWG